MRGPVTALPRGPDFHSVALASRHDSLVRRRRPEGHEVAEDVVKRIIGEHQKFRQARDQ